MQFSNTTTKGGIIQLCERLCGFSDTGISADSTVLKQFTARINGAFDEILPLVLSNTDKLRWDDTNHSDLPIGTFNLVSGQNDYTITSDDNTLSIINIVGVRILTSSSGTEYVDLERVTLDDERALGMLSPNPSESGIPSAFLERGNTVFFDKKPNYNATNGGKIYFEREPAYFASTDTTKEPGIPKPFHDLLGYLASLEWVIQYKPDNAALLTRLEAKIAEKKRQLSDSIEMRNPTTRYLTPKTESNM